MSKIIYLDLENGVSGDMLLGALLDLVDDKEIIGDMVEKLGLEDVDIVATDRKELFSGKDVKVKYDDQPHRTLSEIIDIIKGSSLSKWVLVGTPVIGIPTSVGYGVARGGRSALETMLNSCATGLAVVNIDNGYGAAAFVHHMLGGKRDE